MSIGTIVYVNEDGVRTPDKSTEKPVLSGHSKEDRKNRFSRLIIA